MALKLNDTYVKQFIAQDELAGMSPQIAAAEQMLKTGSGLGSDFLGWIDLPVNYDREEFVRIQKAAQKIKSDSDILIVIGIGGSSFDTVVQICKTLGIKALSDDNSFYLTDETQELLEQYDKLDDYGRHTIAAVMKVEYDRCTEISAPYNGRTGFTSVNIPVEEPVVESLRLNDLKK